MENWFQQKLGLELTMNGLGKTFRIKSESKIDNEKANFCSNTVFSLYFTIGAKKFHTAKPLVFWLHFLFRCDQNHYTNFTSKIMKRCEQILRKYAL